MAGLPGCACATVVGVAGMVGMGVLGWGRLAGSMDAAMVCVCGGMGVAQAVVVDMAWGRMACQEQSLVSFDEKTSELHATPFAPVG